MEVAQISRTIAGALELNVDLAEALALVHDIGHPPFGHAGERTLDLLMRQHGGHFDHNLQALRTVEELELRYIEFRGLNLTFEVREGIVKHSRDYSEADHPELREYLLNQRPPLEAQLIDLTDEIAYSTADLDDGFEDRLLRLTEIRAHVPVFERFFVEVERNYSDAPTKLKFNEALKGMLNRFVTDLIENTGRRVREAGVTSLEELRRLPDRLAAFSPEVEQERREAKSFLYGALYNCEELEPEKQHAEQIISEVFQHLMAYPHAMPRAYQERARNEKPARVVCDYIAGMTDRYIEELRNKLLAR
jgi:dGTPase